MATNTTKLALTKPDGTDLVDIAVLNGNFDKIDAASGATICTSSTRPASPWNGQVIFETDTLNALVYRTATSSWNILGGSTVASEPPAGAGNGNFWWDSDNGKLYIYYNDGNSGQWVSVMPSQTVVDITENYLINGAFDIWQRGTSFTSTAYSADRWYTPITNATVSQETSDLPAGFQYGIKFVTTAANGFAQFNQPIETANVIPLRGKTVTVSGWIKITGSYTGNWISQALFSTSSDAYVSQTTLVTGSNKNVANSSTTSWTRFSNTFTVPSNAVGMRIENIPDAVQPSGVTVRMTGIQLEVGPASTAFRRNQPNIQGELAACQRYFEMSYSQGTVPGSNTTAGMTTIYGTADGSGNIVMPVKFSVVKRTAAYTITTYNSVGTSGQADWTRNGAGSSGTAILYREGTQMFHSYVNVLSAWAVCNGAIHWTCNAEL